ncbi:MAG: RsmB/NOP family class I SAM-dependent RNA methyltransferase [Candidatus Methylopumilus sp.]|nr:RsmB/NOP family class I SAM-dependent RNA methyltransferase [Candidatus Methylopumilus sp.]
MLNLQLIQHCANILGETLDFHGAADIKLSLYFREHREIGQRDRGEIAECVYGIIRRLRFLKKINGEDDNLKKLVLAWLIKTEGRSIRDIESVLNKEEIEWARLLKSIDTESYTWPEKLSLPDWLWDLLVDQYGINEAIALGRSFLEPAQLDIRVNTIKINRDEAMQMLLKDINDIKPMIYSSTGLRIPRGSSLSRNPLFMDGKIEVQDESSQILSFVVDAKRGMMVADFCAGAGGKSLAIGAIMKNTGRIYAYDISEKRIINLGKRLKKSGLSNLFAQKIKNEKDAKLKKLHAKFDRVLVDVPCSGTGTFRRNPDLKWKNSLQGIDELNIKQLSILEEAKKLVKKEGRLIYSTCSLLIQENETIVEKFLDTNKNFRMISADDILIKNKILLSTGKYLKLTPHQQHTDGFFATVLEKID